MQICQNAAFCITVMHRSIISCLLYLMSSFTEQIWQKCVQFFLHLRINDTASYSRLFPPARKSIGCTTCVARGVDCYGGPFFTGAPAVFCYFCRKLSAGDIACAVEILEFRHPA
jgi:hypothetical protein